MALHRQEWFNNQDVETDDQEFNQCTFVNCKLIYRGGNPPDLSRCQFTGCRWLLMDAAIRTIAFMRALKAGGGGDFVNVWIDLVLGGDDLPEAPADELH